MKFEFFNFKKNKSPTKTSPTKTIEEIDDPQLESAYIKYPLNKIIDVSLERKTYSVMPDLKKEDIIYIKNLEKPFSDIHTHPGSSPYPSREDLNFFLKESEKKVKTMIIAQTDEKTGKVLGYGFYTRTKSIPPSSNYVDSLNDVDLLKVVKKERESTGYRVRDALREYKIKSRYVPAKGYKWDIYEGKFVKKDRSNLESK